MLLLVAGQLPEQFRRRFLIAVILEEFRELRAALRRLVLDGEGAGIAFRKVADRELRWPWLSPELLF